MNRETNEHPQFEEIKRVTNVMTDTMDFESIRIFKPQDATTNENKFGYGQRECDGDRENCRSNPQVRGGYS